MLVELAADAGARAAAAARAGAGVVGAAAAGFCSTGPAASCCASLGDGEVVLRPAVGRHLVVLLRREVGAWLVGAGLVGVVEGGGAALIAGGLDTGMLVRCDEGRLGWMFRSLTPR